MDLRQLRYFQAVAHAGRISEAARQLGLSQPALSIALRKLEEEVGVVLFDRDHRGVHLTASGRELLDAVGQATLLIERGRERIAGLEHEPIGRFVLGCPQVLGAYFLPGFASAFLEAHPKIDLVVWCGPSRQVEARVLGREVHFGVVTHPVTHPDLVLLELFRDEVALMASDPPASGFSQAVAGLRKKPLLYVPHVPQAMEIVDLMAARGLLPERRMEIGDVQMVLELALAGVGAGILPRRVAAHAGPGRLQPVHPRFPTVADTIRLIYRSDMHRTRAATLLKDALAAHGRSMA
ncbi:MAG TPA: LysR family transcriptional regulator [Kofleriaceae bacterium]|jgi:DNA-binding transcriptional LysR family regulator